MIINDLVMLGKSVPEPTNERLEHYVCSAGVSAEHGLIRLYPLGLQGTPRRWSVIRVPVERKPGDSRPETWTPIGAPLVVGALCSDDRLGAIDRFTVSGVVEANERRLSLAIVRPHDARFYLDGKDHPEEPTYRLYGSNDEVLKARERFAHTPRVEFMTEDGRSHKLQVRDWGVWELMRKYHARLADMSFPRREEYVGGALHGLTPDTRLFIGNFANHRTSWMIISVINPPK